MDYKKTRGIEHRKLQVIASNYNYSLRRIKALKKENAISSSSLEILKKYEDYVYRIEEAFKKFNMLERALLEREYFTPFPKNWWSAVYPRSTFYRLRLLASRRFLEFYE